MRGENGAADPGSGPAVSQMRVERVGRTRSELRGEAGGASGRGDWLPAARPFTTSSAPACPGPRPSSPPGSRLPPASSPRSAAPVGSALGSPGLPAMSSAGALARGCSAGIGQSPGRGRGVTQRACAVLHAPHSPQSRLTVGRAVVRMRKASGLQIRGKEARATCRLPGLRLASLHSVRAFGATPTGRCWRCKKCSFEVHLRAAFLHVSA